MSGAKTRHRPRIETLEDRRLLAGAGSLDTTFGTGGTVITTFSGSSSDIANEVLTQPDGKLVAVGANMARYNANGSLDTSFGKSGKVSSGGSGAALYPSGTANAGKIVTVGSAYSRKTSYDFTLTRYNANGSVDTTFGSSGKVITDFSNSGDQAHAVVVQPDGKVVVAGDSSYRLPSGAWRKGFALARYNANGSLDTTFGSGGKVITEFLGCDVHDVALLPDGRITVVARAARPGGDGNFVFTVVRYNADGSLDTTFGPDHTGIVQVMDMLADHPGVGSAFTTGTLAYEAFGVTAQPDGKIIAVGSTYGNNQGEGWLIACFDTSGDLDPTFGIRGTTFVKPSGDINLWDQAFGVALQADGSIVVAGGGDSAAGFYVGRFDAAGNLDGTFGSGGLVHTVFGSSPNQTRDVAIQPDGKIVVSGDAATGSGIGFGLARYLGSATVSISSSSRAASTHAGSPTAHPATRRGDGGDRHRAIVGEPTPTARPSVRHRHAAEVSRHGRRPH